MKRAIEVVRAGRWSPAERADTVTLLFDDRYRRRLRMLGDGGLDFLLDLVEPVVLHSGDGLRLEEGGFVEVKAADEDLVEIRGRDPASFARLAWHLGNRHLPAQIDHDRILIRDDHVIVDMLKGLGADVKKVRVPFDPEGGPLFIRDGIKAIDSLKLSTTTRNKVYYGNAMKMLRLEPEVAKVPKVAVKKKAAAKK